MNNINIKYISLIFFLIIINNLNNQTSGDFRNIQIFDKSANISDMRIYNPVAPEDIDATMTDLESYINSDDDMDILIKTALIYYVNFA